MFFSEPVPFRDAIAKLTARKIVPSPADSTRWRLIETGLRERAFFSARVESARLLQSMRDYMEEWMIADRAIESHGGLRRTGRAEFVADMREIAIREGLGKIDPVTGQISPEIREGDLTDIRSIRRLELIFDTQIEAAQEYGYWQQGQDPDILAVFPAQRFIRVRPVLAPRSYHEAALGEIRRKDDLQFWLSLNRDFGVPWGPWGFGSGCGTEDADRDEAIAAGAMKPGDLVKPMDKEFNEGLSAGIKDFDADIAAALSRVTGGRAAAGRLTPRAMPATPTPALAPAPDLAAILAKLGLDDPASVMTPATASKLIDSLKQPAPVNGMAKVTKLSGAQRKGSGLLTRDFIESTVNDLMSFLPPALVNALPDIVVKVVPTMRTAGSYNQTARQLKLNKAALQNPASARKTIFHELIHWAHDHGPKDFEDRIQSFFAARTAGDSKQRLRPWNDANILGKRDKWMDVDGDEYAGRIYDWEPTAKGTEVVTRHLEKLSDPSALARNWNHLAPDGTRAWREAFIECASILFPNP